MTTPESNSGPAVNAGAFAADLARTYAIKLRTPTPPVPSRILFWLTNSELHVVACYRFGQAAFRVFERNKVAGIAAMVAHRIWNRWTTHIDHAEIHPHAQIGPGLLVMHRHGILVNAVIGSNCVIHQNVTIGQQVAGGDQSVPRIGSNVWIGAGAIITGGITVGDGATISAGSVLSRDVPARSLVAGNPGRVIAADYDNSAMLNYLVS